MALEGIERGADRGGAGVHEPINLQKAIARDEAMLIEVGADAPDFTLKTSTGEDFRRSDLEGALRLMMVFYPKDFTPVCSDQLIQVRKNIHHLRRAGVEPVGVNPGDAETHQRFREAHALNFPLLVDENAEVAKAYGAITPEGGILRSVFVVGRNGKVIYAKQGKPAWQLVLNAIRPIDDTAAAD